MDLLFLPVGSFTFLSQLTLRVALAQEHLAAFWVPSRKTSKA